MSLTPVDIETFRDRSPVSIIAELTSVKGSSPRTAGTFMLVGADATLGTIGGGQLEYLAIQRARQMLAHGIRADFLDIPLGPEIGQCCGGRVTVALEILDAQRAAAITAMLAAEQSQRPHVYVFGAGHVGHALARALALLPLHTHVVDTRPSELAGFPDGVQTHAVPMPEAVVRNAPLGSTFVILTHDHALDFLIAAEALRRDDAPYIGMVGSRTKRAKFSSWFKEEGGDAGLLERLVLPIGGRAFPQGLGDKRPEVIAALAAAEIMVHIGWREVENSARAAGRHLKVGNG